MAGDLAAAPGVLLSPAQHPIWRAEILYSGTPRWTQVTVLRMAGAVDLDRLERAVQAGFDRYPALRTRLVLDGDTPRQHFAPPYRLHLQRERLPGGAASLGARLAQAAGVCFELYDQPLFRPELLLLGEGDCALLLLLHHVAADGIGGGLLIGHIAAAYRGDVPADLPESPAYGQWLARQAGEPADLDAALAVFRDELAGAVMHSPALYDRPDEGPFAEPPDLPESNHTFDVATARALQRLARSHQATPFLLFFAAYAAALSEATGTDDLVVATYVSGRHREPADLIGMCINTVLVRVRLAGDADGPACLEAVKAAWSRVRRLQNVPLMALYQAGGGAIPAAAQFAINYLDMAQVPFELPGIATEVMHAQQGFPPNDLLFYVLREQDGRIRMRLINGSGTPALSRERVAALLDAIVRTLGAWLRQGEAP